MLQALNSTEAATSATEAPRSIAAQTAAAPTVNQTEALVLVHHLDQDGNELQAADMIAGTIGEEIHCQPSASPATTSSISKA
nr:MucBP domain-containing protein [Lactiplantibacillus plantarum]